MNSISENPTKIKIIFVFYQVQHTIFRVSLCTYYSSEKNLGCAYWSRCAKQSQYGSILPQSHEPHCEKPVFGVSDHVRHKLGCPTKIKIIFDFYQVQHAIFRVSLCTYYSSEKNLGCAYWSRCAKQSQYGSILPQSHEPYCEKPVFGVSDHVRHKLGCTAT